MFKLIGGVVVCGLALYGLVKYLERPVVKVVIHPQTLGNAKEGASSASTDDGPRHSEVSADTSAPYAEPVPQSA